MTTETQNPTPSTEGGASTQDPLDRLERWLSAGDGSEQDGQPETEDQPAEESDVKPDGDGQQSEEPQLTTSDLAKLLKLDDGAPDLDEEGQPIFKTKVDGKEGTAKLQDLLKSYQLQEHVDKKSREASEREKALERRAQEVEQQFGQRLQYAEDLAHLASQQLLAEYQSIDWATLGQQDPGRAALLRQEFQEKQAQLRGVFYNIEQERGQSEAGQGGADMQESLAKEAERLPTLIPEWKDQGVMAKETAEIRDWALKFGLDPQEVSNVTKATHVAILRKAMLADRLMAQKPAIENRVRQAPKLVKPGQPQADRQQATLNNIKQTVKKSSGSVKSVMDYLMATGKA